MYVLETKIVARGEEIPRTVDRDGSRFQSCWLLLCPLTFFKVSVEPASLTHRIYIQVLTFRQNKTKTAMTSQERRRGGETVDLV